VTRAIILFAAGALLSACAAPAEQEAAADGELECEIDGRSFVVSHPWTCLREGGRIVEPPSEPSAWIVEAVKVKWQGRDAITSGQFHYNRFGNKGEMRLDLPEAGDSCRGAYRLHSFGDADWLAVCDSGLKIRGTVFLDEGGVSVGGHGKDGDGRNFGFFAQPES
jgi:hypothetical protein